MKLLAVKNINDLKPVIFHPFGKDWKEKSFTDFNDFDASVAQEAYKNAGVKLNCLEASCSGDTTYMVLTSMESLNDEQIECSTDPVSCKDAKTLIDYLALANELFAAVGSGPVSVSEVIAFAKEVHNKDLSQDVSPCVLEEVNVLFSSPKETQDTEVEVDI